MLLPLPSLFSSFLVLCARGGGGAGFRALAGGAHGSTAKASRAHEIVAIAPGYIQVVGGKLTAYRAIAADAADAAARHLGVSAPSTTDEELLVGAGLAPDALAALTETIAALGYQPRYAELLLGPPGGEEPIEVVGL